MRLTRKLTLALTAILIVQFALYGYFSARRHTGFFERDIKRDALQVGRTLSTAVARMWKSQGEEAALELVAETNNDTADMLIRFVWLTDDAEPAYRPELPLPSLSALMQGKFLVRHVYPNADSDYIYTYVRVPLDSPNPGALELRQSFIPEHAFTRTTMVRVALFFIVVVMTTAVVMWFLGLALVARPIEKLCDKARRIGKGDFSGYIEVRGNDEIALLARDINQMSDELYQTRRLLEEETAARIKTLEQLRHVDRLTTIGTLASGVAHELGTPLNVASAQLAGLGAATNADDLSRIQSSLNDQITKMTGIVRQLLSFSRRRTPEKQPIDLAKVVERVVKMLTPFGERRNVAIHWSGSSDPVVANVDETQMEQVVTNLLVNAMQAMDHGDIRIGISSETLPSPGDLTGSTVYRRITVRDSGKGMSDEELKQIFDPFFTTKAPGQGTGMGLSIAHGIVVEHRGWISVDSAPGRGSCFSVYVPIEDAA